MTLTYEERRKRDALRRKLREIEAPIVKARKAERKASRVPREKRIDHKCARPNRGRVLEKDYLAWLRRQRCTLAAIDPQGCGGRIDPAHIRFSDFRVGRTNPGKGRKSDDRWCVSLCRTHHEAQHRFGNEQRWWAQWNLDPNEIAIAQHAAFERGAA